jgi:D-tyrosyl-tRNA(Tyr) deacylase
MGMISVIQRVTQAKVSVDGISIGRISRGILALVAVERGDGEEQAQRLGERILSYRIFPDPEDRMNLSLVDIGGELLLVSQFTLAADTRKGARPSFTPAAAPEEGRNLFEYFVDRVREKHPATSTGLFCANMQISLVNDGPVTFYLRIPPKEKLLE